MKYHLILTLDYELFGNGSGCIENCVVQPVNRLNAILAERGAFCTYFVDALEFVAIREQKQLPSSLSLASLEKQLTDLGNSSHNLQLHLHPQWLDASYNNGSWSLNNDYWRIGDLDESTINTAVDIGISYIQEFSCRPISTFRAGGWAIQPSKSVLKILRQRDIFMDSTVAPGAFNLAKGDWFDFTSYPDAAYWHIDDDICTKTQSGSSTEVPIATAKIGRIPHFKALREHRGQQQFPEYCSGTYDGPNTTFQEYIGKMSRLLSMGRVMLDFSTLPAWAMIEATQTYIDRFPLTRCDIPIVAIGHNKNFSRQSEHNLSLYLDWAKNHAEIVFSTFDDWKKTSREQKIAQGID